MRRPALQGLAQSPFRAGLRKLPVIAALAQPHRLCGDDRDGAVWGSEAEGY
jgi:hypothetical protein